MLHKKDHSREFRDRIRWECDPVLLPGAPNALTARVLEEAGCEAIYVSGAGIANSFLGVPDIGLLTLSELTAHVSAVREAVDVPLVIDADTGFGNALSVVRTVRALERAGANAIQIEDQVTPKRCGHFDGTQVISAAEMKGKIHAATDARLDDNVQIVARTDARASLGIAEACERAAQYVEAGADAVFIEAPRSLEEIARIPQQVPGPLFLNMVEGGLTPILPLKEVATMGFAVVLYANTALRAAMKGMQDAASALIGDGDSLRLDGNMVGWDERQRLVNKAEFDRLDEKYGGDA